MLLNKKLLFHDQLPEDMQKIIKELKKSENKEACLLKAYNILANKYRGQRGATYTKLHHLAVSDINKLWAKQGFMHCTNINYIMKLLLVRSGFFTENDIIAKWTHVWYISPHQYLKIKIKDNQYINIDIWAKIYGISFGDFAKGFH